MAEAGEACSQHDAASRLGLIEQELRPPEPQLLDTCVLQNLDWVNRTLEAAGGRVIWDDVQFRELAERYGPEHARDLVDLGTLSTEFESRSGFPWLVSETTQHEISRADQVRRLGSLLEFFRDHQNDWSDDAYPGLAKGLLFPRWPARVSPLVLRALGVTSVDQVEAATGPLSVLPDEGDRSIAARALLANIPVVLTTDRSTFWRYRIELKAFGLAVMRPTDLLRLYEPYWDALDEEFTRRRSKHP